MASRTGGGKAGKQLAMEQVYENADEDWKDAAKDALLRVADRGRDFTSEDVTEEIPDGVSTHEPRAMGPVMLWGIRHKVMEPVGWSQSRLKTSNQYPKRVYRPLRGVSS